MINQKIQSIENDIAEIGNVLLKLKDSNGSNSTASSSSTHSPNSLNNSNNSNSNNSKKKTNFFLKELLESEPRLNDLKKFYSNILFIAIYNSVINSLKCLAQSCGFEFENILNLLNNDNYNGSNFSCYTSQNSTELVQKYIRVKSADLFLLNQQQNLNENLNKPNNANDTSDRPISAVTSAILKSNWSDDRKLDDAFLK